MDVIFYILMAAVVLVAGAAAKWYRDAHNAEMVAFYTEQFHEWAEKVVLAAEDAGKFYDMTGKEKLTYATKRLQEINDKYNLPFSDEQISDLVRAAYQKWSEGLWDVFHDVDGEYEDDGT